MRGEIDTFVDWRYYMVHCTFMWRLAHQSTEEGYVGRHVVNLAHTKHCQHSLLMDAYENRNVRTPARIVYPRCVKFSVEKVVCLAALAGVAASKAFVWHLVALGRPGLTPRPEGFFPEFARVQTTFMNGGEFTRNDSRGDVLWNSLVPIGTGYVRVSNPRQYPLLPESEVLEDNGSGYAEMYQASVVHQLHCIVWVLPLDRKRIDGRGFTG
ncbi:hypothetical protein PVAG01_10442 [Phlyctema vagabunda]|uniref:Uncharacterized protein n=1 Tax=Phlyctema vagabunda TaxID=108571 RepID=A0ABR4P5Z8_9HELO